MTGPSADQQLIRAYAGEGSETAFQALVNRHVDLVYATALRQLGDPQSAEEVTQNVFLALARKAPRLTGFDTLSGWLHRTTLLEAKARIRAELRRRRREDKAGALIALEREGVSPWERLLPVVDEALLHLRESDRVALILRFLEERPFREIGIMLGVDEDAARKRVSRALDRVTDFFRKRGLALPAGAGAAAVLSKSLSAAPVGLAASTAHAALAQSSAGTLNLLWMKFMALNKTQTALVCALVAAGPLGWEWRAGAHLTRAQEQIEAQHSALASRAGEIQGEIRRRRDELVQARADAQNATAQVAVLRAGLAAMGPTPGYQWDDNSSLARIPKSLLERASIGAVADRRGQLKDKTKEVLQLTEAEAQQTQAALDRFLGGFYAAQAEGLRAVEPSVDDLQGHQPEQMRVFEMTSVGPRLAELRERLFAELETVLGAERFALFKGGLQGWMPVEDDSFRSMISGDMVVLNFDRRERFYQPEPGSRAIRWGFVKSDRSGALQSSIELDQIPEMYRPYLADWIALANTPVAEKALGQP